MGQVEFASAAEVRRHLKEKGITGRVSIRWHDNPFGGRGLFWVKLLDMPAGVVVVHEVKPNAPTATFTSDGGLTAARFAALRAALEGTNARA